MFSDLSKYRKRLISKINFAESGSSGGALGSKDSSHSIDSVSEGLSLFLIARVS